jgi:hypothetical protein
MAETFEERRVEGTNHGALTKYLVEFIGTFFLVLTRRSIRPQTGR